MLLILVNSRWLASELKVRPGALADPPAVVGEKASGLLACRELIRRLWSVQDVDSAVYPWPLSLAGGLALAQTGLYKVALPVASLLVAVITECVLYSIHRQCQGET